MSIARLMQMAAAGSAGAGPEPSGWTDPDLANASYDSVSFSVAGQETSPHGIFFKPDGSKVYICGTSSDAIHEYDLSTAWDVSSCSFVQSFSVLSQEGFVTDLVFKPDGSKFYIIGSTGDEINEYNLSAAWDVSTASYVQNFSVASQETVAQGLFFSADGLKMFIVGAGNDTVYQYVLSSSWDISSASYDSKSFSVATQETNPNALFFSPSLDTMFIVGSNSDSVHEYSLSTNGDVSSASYGQSFSVSSQENNPRGMSFKDDGSKMYIVGFGSDTIYQYSTAAAAPAEWTDPDLANASYDSVSFSVAGQDTSPQGLFFRADGEKMYLVGTTGDDINEYDLSVAWDVSTASYVQNFVVSAQEVNPSGVSFKPDGTKMYVTGFTTGKKLYQYTLSTAWDVSTASYDSVSLDVSTQDATPRSGFFSDDGLYLLVCGLNNDTIFQYDLGSAWDLSTASYSGNSFSVTAQEGLPTSVFASPTGNKIFVLGLNNDSVYQYSLSTAWDISTASYDSVSFSVASQETVPTTLFFKADGSKMYVVGSTNDTIYQYSTA
jgi:sugar lactone lactonase YvrE